MTFRMRYLSLVLFLAVSAGAQPTTQPATSPAEAPPVIKGVLVGRVIREEDVKFAVRSVRHQVVYEIADNVLKPAQLGPMPARLRCEVNLPLGTDARPSYRSEVTSVEDDNAADLLKPLRAPDGRVIAEPVSGSIWNEEQRQGPLWVEAPLPFFPRLPRTLGRVAGIFTLIIPAEARSFEFPLDKIGATAVVSDTVTMTLVSCNIETNGVYEIKLRVKGMPAPKLGGTDTMMFKSAVGYGPDTPDGKRGNPLGAMNVSYNVDGMTIQFAPSAAKFVKTLGIIVNVKTLEIPLQYDLRTRPMM